MATAGEEARGRAGVPFDRGPKSKGLLEETGVERASMRRNLIVGLGATGAAVARFLTARGERVRVIDSRVEPPGLGELRAACPSAEVCLETLDERWLDDVDRVVVSPGLGAEIPLAREARRRGLPLVGDIELFATAATAPILAITGSNGKSTVTTLTARMLAAHGLHAPVGGNLAPPALDLLDDRADAYVLEISSFQMETTTSLKPLAGAVLNVSADHLDRHGSLERYAELKGRLLDAATYGVYNADDPIVAAIGARHPRGIPFSVATVLARGYSVVEHRGERWLARDAAPLLAVAELGLRGTHNEANALAALALTAQLEPDFGPSLEVLKAFRGLPHRCQLVAQRQEVRFVDDSKGTNVGATIAAIGGLTGPLVLIAGGLGKGQNFRPLAAAARGKVRAAVLIGTAAAELGSVLEPVCTVARATDMANAVEQATALAEPGDTVLLSPACASQDMFRDYRDRGEAFARAVRELPA